MDAIRTAALTVVAEVSTDDEPGQTGIIRATKIVRDRTGCDLRTARDAVLWVIDRPASATLPAGSIVGFIGGAFFKEETSAESAYPWAATHVTGQITDAHVDELLRSDRATILRVGDGRS